MNKERGKSKEKETAQPNQVFFLERDFYSNPEVIIIVAPNMETATEMLNQKLKGENYPPGTFGKLQKLDLRANTIKILRPPGDRHLDR